MSEFTLAELQVLLDGLMLLHNPELYCALGEMNDYPPDVIQARIAMVQSLFEKTFQKCEEMSLNP